MRNFKFWHVCFNCGAHQLTMQWIPKPFAVSPAAVKNSSCFAPYDLPNWYSAQCCGFCFVLRLTQLFMSRLTVRVFFYQVFQWLMCSYRMMYVCFCVFSMITSYMSGMVLKNKVVWENITNSPNMDVLIYGNLYFWFIV